MPPPEPGSGRARATWVTAQPAAGRNFAAARRRELREANGRRKGAVAPGLGHQLPGPDAILLELVVEGLVVDPQESSSLALVASGHSQHAMDDLLLHVSRRPERDLFQGKAVAEIRLPAGKRRRRLTGGAHVREVFRPDEVLTQEGRSADDVSQLPGIARPRALHERRDPFLRESPDPLPQVGVGL